MDKRGNKNSNSRDIAVVFQNKLSSCSKDSVLQKVSTDRTDNRTDTKKVARKEDERRAASSENVPFYRVRILRTPASVNRACVCVCVCPSLSYRRMMHHKAGNKRKIRKWTSWLVSQLVS